MSASASRAPSRCAESGRGRAIPGMQSRKLESGPAAETTRFASRGFFTYRQVHRRRLRVAEDQPRREVEEHRQENASERIDVANRVQADASLVARGRVAELKRAPRMGRLVERDREEDDRELNREIDDFVFQSAANISERLYRPVARAFVPARSAGQSNFLTGSPKAGSALGQRVRGVGRGATAQEIDREAEASAEAVLPEVRQRRLGQRVRRDG